MKTFQSFDIDTVYQSLHHKLPNKQNTPVIGITGNYTDGSLTLASGYYTSILKAGGIPFIIPPFQNDNILQNLLNHIDGLLLTGGADINPLYLGEDPIKEVHQINPHRDRQEILLTRLASNRQIPILGICRGIQILNFALGGNIYQDIYRQHPQTCIKHSQELDRSFASHHVKIAKDSLLYHIFQTELLPVNSFHHQAVNKPAPGFKISATSSDGITEAIESTEYKSIIGVQWHPECFILNQDECMMPLFQWLTNEAHSFQKAKTIHQHTLILDSHCDTPMFFDKGINFAHRDPQIKVDLHKMSEGRQDATIMVAYLEQKECSEEGLLAATAKANLILDKIEHMVAMNHDTLEIAYTPTDLYRIKQISKKAIMLGIENGYAIGKDLSQIKHFRNRGVIYMTLCHNGNNNICGSARYNEEGMGVTDFGEKVIQEMNHLGMLIDLSHAGEKSFFDTLDISTQPVICSHSSAKALCNNPRNLTDQQLKAIAYQGGVVQICLYGGFLNRHQTATINDAIAHLNHMVSIMGIEHVGIGSDFDGDGGIIGCNDSSEMINLTRKLLYERYSETDIAKIWGGNLLRVMEQVQQNMAH